MKNCRHCNHEVEFDSTTYCPNCGKSLQRVVPPAAPPVTPPAVPIESQRVIVTGVQMSFGNILGLLFQWAFAGVIVGLVFGVVYLFVTAL